MSKADQLAAALDDFLSVSPEVEAAAVVSSDGLPIASALPPHVEEDRLAAMSAALLTLGERAAEGLGKGELAQVFVEGDVGHVILMSAGQSAVLVAVSSKEAKVGLVLFEMRKTANRVSEIMNQDYPDVAHTEGPMPTADPTAPYAVPVPDSIAAMQEPPQAAEPVTPEPVTPEPIPASAGVFAPETSNGGVVGSVTVSPTGEIGTPAAPTPAQPEPEATPTTTTPPNETESSVSSWT